MLRSFRLKIGLLSLCVSGLLLLGLGLYAISVLDRVGLERVDRELRALADAQVRQTQPPEHWKRFDDLLRLVYGTEASRQFAVKVTVAERGDAVYATSEWPADLPREVMPLPHQAAPKGSAEKTPDQPRPPATKKDRDDVRRPRPGDDRPPPPRELQVSGPVYATQESPGGAWRIMTIANEEVALSIAMNLAGVRAETGRFQRALLVAVPLGLLLLVAGGWLIGQMALRPVKAIARTAESVTARRLNERIPREDADAEFKQLIELINGMLERLERSFQQANRFSADAAHELKTPLAVLQAQIERSLQRAPDGSPEQHECAEQLDEVQRLRAILRKLLLLSQADAGHLPISPERFDFVHLVRTTAEDIQVLAPGRKTTVQVPASLFLTGDGDLLNQAVQNLLSNAIKFGDLEGTIAIQLAERSGMAVLTVSNTGATIPADEQGRIFDRFYRADKSRSREIEGSGLGLSLAREIVRAHGGDLVLERSEANLTTFAMKLPASVTELQS